MIRELTFVLKIANTFLKGNQAHLRDAVVFAGFYYHSRKNLNSLTLGILFP